MIDPPHFETSWRFTPRNMGSTSGLLSALVLALGCSGGPSAIKPVSIDAGDASELAIESYDQDGDQQLSEAELAAIPGMLKHRDKYDTDENGLISADEIYARIELWEVQAMGIRPLSIAVELDGRPLPDAEVVLTPESYLGDGPKPARGKTNAAGTARVSVASEDLPQELREARVRGVYGGTYKIEVTHPAITIAPRFNEKTELGEEVARDTIGDQVKLTLERQ